MATKKNDSTTLSSSESNKFTCPKTLDELTFFKRLPFVLTEEQMHFCEAVYNPKNIGVICDACAGSSKTTLAVGMAMLMAEQFGMYDSITYVISPCAEHVQGMLPGSLEDKTKPYLTPLYQALETWGYQPEKYIKSEDDMSSQKNGTALIRAIPHTFLRGATIQRSVLIVEEAQNFLIHDLQKVLSRVSDSSKVIIIGHREQCDLKYPGDSGFATYIEKARKVDFVEQVELKENHRGKFSQWADEI